MKKLIALTISLVLVVGLFAGCGQTRDNEAELKGPDITILANAGVGDEAYANVVRDQLVKAGFNPTISMQPDYASFRSQIDAGNFDLAITYWNTVTGSPDYAMRSVWHSEGPLNLYKIYDDHMDELIELGASQTEAEYRKTYEELETYMIEEKAYTIPIYVSYKTLAFNNKMLQDESVHVSKSRSMQWEPLNYVDESLNDTQPCVLTQTYSDLTPLDPVRSDDGSTFQLNTNSYIRLVNLTDTDEITTNSTLTRAYAIGESNADFYFLLRDDVNFAKVEDMHAVDSGERVGAEDVVFSIDRMVNKDRVPDHKNFANFTAVDGYEIYIDLEALKTAQAQEGKTVYETLMEGATGEITALTADKTQVDNANGTYQVVHVTTKYAFPQILNVFAHSSGGIVSKNQIETINAGYDPATYDVAKDVLYGDQVTYTEGAGYNNTLVCSGPYIPIKKNDYEILFEKNPGYMPQDEYAPHIKTIQVKIIKDTENALSALRAGELYLLQSIPTSKIEIVKEDENLTFKEISGNAYNYVAFNFSGVFGDEDLRKAALYAIDQKGISAVFNDRLIPTYSPLTPVLQTGKELLADPQKSAEYLKKWIDKQ